MDDRLLDGTQTNAISASAPGYVGATETLDVTDYETLWVTIADESISERDGSTTATVTRIDLSGDLTVNLTSSDTTEATVVDFVVIADGSTVSPTFTIAAVDDLIVDGRINCLRLGFLARLSPKQVSQAETLVRSPSAASGRWTRSSRRKAMSRSRLQSP